MHRVHNLISELWMHQLQLYISLETLDLSSNSISEIKAGAFPPMQLKYLWVLPVALFSNYSKLVLMREELVIKVITQSLAITQKGILLYLLSLGC